MAFEPFLRQPARMKRGLLLLLLHAGLMLLVAGFAAAKPAPEAVAFVAVSAANLRSSPSEASAVRFRLPFGTPVQVVADDGGFLEVRTRSEPAEVGFLGKALVRPKLELTKKDKALVRALGSQPCCPLPQLTPLCRVCDHPEELFATCRGRDNQSACEGAIEAKRKKEWREAHERYVSSVKEPALPRVLELWRLLLAPDSPYAQTPPHVLTSHPALKSVAAPAWRRGADPADPAAMRAQVGACLELPPPGPSALAAKAAAIEVSEVWPPIPSHFRVVRAPHDDADELGKLRATFDARARLLLDEDRRLSSPAPLPMAYLHAKAPRAQRLELTLAFGGAGEGLQLRPQARLTHDGSGLVLYDAKGLVVSLVEQPRKEGAPFAAPLKPRSADPSCAGASGVGFDLDGDGVLDVLHLARSWETDDHAEGTYSDVLLNDGDRWVPRLLAWQVVNDL